MEPDPDVRRTFALNGLSIHVLKVNQEGDLDVEFDLPHPQTTAKYHSQLRGLRTFSVYDDPEMESAVRRLFEIVRGRVMADDPKRAAVHCDRCATSACCRLYNVLVTEADILRLAEGLGASPEEVRERYTVKAVDWSGDFERQLSADRDGAGEEKCVFLKLGPGGQYRCSVYESRPQICRDFDMASCHDFEPLPALVPAEKVRRTNGAGGSPAAASAGAAGRASGEARSSLALEVPLQPAGPSAS